MRSLLRPSFMMTAAIFIFLTVLLFVCLNYDPDTRAVPLLIISGGLILSALLLAGEIFPQLAARLEANLFSGATDLGGNEGGERTDPAESKKNFIIVSIWIILFFVFILLFGYLISVFLAIFLFLKIGRQIPWIKSLIVSGASWLVVFIVFEVLMQLRLFKGLLFGGIIS